MTSQSPPLILIVDDERNNRKLLEVMLSAEGYRTISATTGEEALAMVAEHTPDLVLLDVMMPGVDGYQVASQIKANERTRNTRIILITALNDLNSQKHGMTAGADAFLSKPVERVELFARVNTLLGTRSQCG
jgi:diguanylate cyclase